MEIVDNSEIKEEDNTTNASNRPQTPPQTSGSSTTPSTAPSTSGTNNQVTTSSPNTVPTVTTTSNSSQQSGTGPENTTTEENMTETSQVIELREPTTRPIYRLSVKLIDTYKHINKVYYEAKARKIREQQGSNRVGIYNDGYDDQNYDYIIHGDEMFAERYILKHRIGKVIIDIIS